MNKASLNRTMSANDGPVGSSGRAPGHSHRPGSPLSHGFFAGIVLLCDVLSILLCGAALHAVYLHDLNHTFARDIAATGLFAVLIVLSLHSTGLYRFTAIVDPKRQLLRIFGVFGAVFVLLTAAGVVLEFPTEFSHAQALAWLVATVALTLFGRIMIAGLIRALARSGRLGRRILVYGATEQARKLLERIDQLEEPWNYIVGVFDDRMSRVGPTVGRYPVMGNLEDLIAWGRVNPLDEVLVALPWGAEERLMEITRALAVLPANVRLCPELFQEEVMQGRTSRQFGLPMWNAFEKPLAGWDAIFKRAFDIAFSTIVLLLAAPLLLVIAILIKLESPGPVLFRQPRYGFNHEVIEVFKFRSMRNESADPEGRRLTERDDPRVTRVGKLMRRTSLDELPQIINVLRGEMSIVGPRPHALRTTAGGKLCEDVVDRYSIRHKMKPGITGWAQVNGLRGTMEEEEHLRKRIEHDLYYINNWSPWLDLKILAMTLWIVILGRNSY